MRRRADALCSCLDDQISFQRIVGKSFHRNPDSGRRGGLYLQIGAGQLERDSQRRVLSHDQFAGGHEERVECDDERDIQIFEGCFDGREDRAVVVYALYGRSDVGQTLDEETLQRGFLDRMELPQHVGGCRVQRNHRRLDQFQGFAGIGQTVFIRLLDGPEFRGQRRRLTHHRRVDGAQFLRRRAGKRIEGVLDQLFLQLVGRLEAFRHRRLDQPQLGRQRRRLALHRRFDGRQFRFGRSAQPFDRLPQQRLLRRSVGEAFHHRRLDHLQLRLQGQRLALDRGVYGCQLFVHGAVEGLDGLPDPGQLCLLVGQAFLDGHREQVELRRQARRLARHRIRDGRQPPGRLLSQGIERLLQQFPSCFLVGQAFFHRRFDQPQLHRQAGRLALHRRLDGRQLLAGLAGDGGDRRRNQRPLRRGVGETASRRRFN